MINPLETDRLLIRSITALDIDKVHFLHSLAKVDEFNTLGIPSSIEETKLLLENWITENNKENIQRFTFAVNIKADRQFIGVVGINIGKAKYKNAEVWFKFDPEFWNKGYATETLRVILKVGFDDLKLHRIEAGCAVDNVASIKVLEKVGMFREAHTRKLLPLKLGWSDNYGYAKLSTD
jgi:RimJ/RimL family protein N-acetyltransferase